MRPSYLQDLFQVLQFGLELAFLLHSESSSPLRSPRRARHVQPSPVSRRTGGMKAVRIYPEWEGGPQWSPPSTSAISSGVVESLESFWTDCLGMFIQVRTTGHPAVTFLPAPSHLHHTHSDWFQLGMRPSIRAILYPLDILIDWGSPVTLV